MNAPPVETDVSPTKLERRLEFSALVALFVLAVRQQAGGRRLLVMGALFALPAILAGIVRYFNPDGQSDLEQALVFLLIPHALVPLMALWSAAGMIQDEIEEQTLTYLLIRPLPRWALYVTKLLATVLVAAVLAGVFVILTDLAIYVGTAPAWDILLPRMAKTVVLVALSLTSYASLFGLVSLFARRTLVAGVAYIVVLEGLIANIDFVARRLTVMYYFRVLAERWLPLHVADWSIDLSEAPSARVCVLTLVGVSISTTIVAAAAFAAREFRLKTPEGS